MVGVGVLLSPLRRGGGCVMPARAAVSTVPVYRWLAKSSGPEPGVLEALQGRRESDPKRGDYRGIVDSKGGVMHYLRHGGSLKRVNAPLVEPPASRHMVPFDLPNPNLDKAMVPSLFPPILLHGSVQLIHCIAPAHGESVGQIELPCATSCADAATQTGHDISMQPISHMGKNFIFFPLSSVRLMSFLCSQRSALRGNRCLRHLLFRPHEIYVAHAAASRTRLRVVRKIKTKTRRTRIKTRKTRRKISRRLIVGTAGIFTTHQRNRPRT